MSKMHQIRCRLGLCPKPRWGNLQRSPKLDQRGPTSRGMAREGKNVLRKNLTTGLLFTLYNSLKFANFSLRV